MVRAKAAQFKFTRASVDSAKCPAGKAQVLYRDTETPALVLRVTATGSKAFVFEQRLAGRTVRVTIGPASMQIRAAKDKSGKPVTAGADAEAARLAGLVSQGTDPRAEKRDKIATQAAARQAAQEERAKLELLALDAWAAYCADRHDAWGPRNYADHLRMADAGGAERKRAREKLTKPGPLFALLNRPLAKLDAQAVENWVIRETRARPAFTALGFRCLRAFVNWCAEHAEYRSIVHTDACASKKAREKLAKPNRKSDVLQREQLKPWFAEVRKLSPAMAAYLQVLLLTGCRAGEALHMQWDNVGFKWQWIRIRDKVEGERLIPLTPYVAGLLRELKVRNDRCPEPPRRIKRDPEADVAFRLSWEPSPSVFVARLQSGERLADASHAHKRALAAAGLPHITLHGLRRSFGTLAEWVECPVGIVAQIMGHKPSALAEKHYRVRPIDLLRMWHERIEAWILEQAGIDQPKIDDRQVALRVVSTM